MLSRYKQWVKRHPGLVQKLDWLDWLTWLPNRTSGGSELAYEVYHAGIGLFALWNQTILEEGELPTPRPSPYYWLDAIEYVETLIELRGMQLESTGKMSRYGPLLVLEVVKSVLKMAAWSRYSGHMLLRHPSLDDLHQFESELGLQDILASLERLRLKYVAGMGDERQEEAKEEVERTLRFTPPSAPQPPATAAATVAFDAEVKSSVSSEIVAVEVTDSDAVSCSAGGACTAGSLNSGAYGVRTFMAGPFSWVRGLVLGFGLSGAGGGPGSNTGSCGGGGGMRASAGGEGRRSGESKDVSTSCSRTLSCAVCSTSPRCSTNAAASSASHGPWIAGVPWVWPEVRQRLHEQFGSPDGVSPLAGGSGVQVPLQPKGTATGCRRAGGFGDERAGSSPEKRWRVQLQREERKHQQSCGGSGTAAAGTECEDPDMHMGRNLLWLSELLYIWRPVVYVSLLKRYGRCSWRPWLASLALDLLSGHFHRRGRQHVEAAEARAAARAAEAEAGAHGSEGVAEAKGERGSQAMGPGDRPRLRVPIGAGTSLLSLALARALAAPGVTTGEEREFYDRRRKLLLYALRSPFLEAVTLPVLSAIRKATWRVPLVGYGVGYMCDTLETFTSYYSYTSGSN